MLWLYRLFTAGVFIQHRSQSKVSNSSRCRMNCLAPFFLSFFGRAADFFNLNPLTAPSAIISLFCPTATPYNSDEISGTLFSSVTVLNMLVKTLHIASGDGDCFVFHVFASSSSLYLINDTFLMTSLERFVLQ